MKTNKLKIIFSFVILMLALSSCTEDKDDEAPSIDIFQCSYSVDAQKLQYELKASDNTSIKSIVVYLNSDVIYSFTAEKREDLTRHINHTSIINTESSAFTLKAVVTDYAGHVTEKMLEKKTMVSLSGNKAKINTGNSDTIVWTGLDYSTINIELYKGGKICKGIYYKLNSNYGQCFWSVPVDLVTGSDYKIRITNAYNSSEYVESSLFTVESIISLKIVSPDSTSSWEGGTCQTIIWNSNNLYNDIRLDLYYKGSFYTTIGTYACWPETISNSGSCKWLVPNNIYDNQFKIRITSVNNEAIYAESELFTITKPKIANGTMTDIDGNVYRTVTIGNQTWMAENLRVTHFNDGKSIAYETNNSKWQATSSPAFNYQYVDTGNLYNWYAVSTNKLAPTGWHVATDGEWDTLTQYLGAGEAGYALKEPNNYWIPNNGITNSSGFSATVSGFRDWNGDSYYINAYFWTSTEGAFTNNALCRVLKSENALVSGESRDKHTGCAVRCVKDYK